MSGGVKIGMKTPWGPAEVVDEIADGIYSVSTAGHGGLKLDRRRQAAMPSYLRSEAGWYEEDCEWSKVVVVHAAAFSKDKVDGAYASLKNWYPDLYETFTGHELQDGESTMRDQEVFNRRHKSDWVAVAAWGSWKDGVPEGMVGVLATVGGERSEEADRAYFLVPEDEYSERGSGGFIVNPAVHKKIASLG